MGQDLHAVYPAAKAVFLEVSDATGIDVAKLCFESDEETLRQTENAQLALYTCGLAAWFALREGLSHDVTNFAGHSVGEYAAIVAAGALGVGAGAKLVRKRGEIMARAVQTRPGTMAAILGMERADLEQLCQDVGEKGVCVIANDNALPGKGIGKLVGAGLVKKTIASHIGLNPETQKKMIDGRKATWFDFHVESLKLNAVPLHFYRRP